MTLLELIQTQFTLIRTILKLVHSHLVPSILLYDFMKTRRDLFSLIQD